MSLDSQLLFVGDYILAHLGGEYLRVKVGEKLQKVFHIKAYEQYQIVFGKPLEAVNVIIVNEMNVIFDKGIAGIGYLNLNLSLKYIYYLNIVVSVPRILTYGAYLQLYGQTVLVIYFFEHTNISFLSKMPNNCFCCHRISIIY